ncbi:hypothetical protein MKW94_030058, partial [Papaver nudicaule]|nr:hypothetical protein [Papaver nudicaule]
HLVVAHRGSNGEFPEETAAAYMRAIEEGADFIETNILSSKDGHLVCFHDLILDLTTDIADHKEFADRKRTYKFEYANVTVTGFFIVDFTLKELSHYGNNNTKVISRVPSKFSIITFEEYISVALDAPRVVGIYPEIKDPISTNKHVEWPNGNKFEDKFVQMLQNGLYSSSVLLSNMTDLPKILLIGDMSIPTQHTLQYLFFVLHS